MGHWFEWVRLLGAAYLIWMGWQMFRSSGRLADGDAPAAPRGGFFLQGLLVAVSNPKTLIFFGAFFPQFIDPRRQLRAADRRHGPHRHGLRRRSDGLRIGRRPRRPLPVGRRVEAVSRISGSFLIGGGLWLAFSRAK